MNEHNKPSLPDFDNMVWKCPCCGQKKNDRFIKVVTHDVGALFNHETGSIFVNCKYCTDTPGCKDKALSREWVLEHFFGRFQKDANYSVEL